MADCCIVEGGRAFVDIYAQIRGYKWAANGCGCSYYGDFDSIIDVCDVYIPIEGACITIHRIFIIGGDANLNRCVDNSNFHFYVYAEKLWKIKDCGGTGEYIDIDVTVSVNSIGGGKSKNARLQDSDSLVFRQEEDDCVLVNQEGGIVIDINFKQNEISDRNPTPVTFDVKYFPINKGGEVYKYIKNNPYNKSGCSAGVCRGLL